MSRFYVTTSRDGLFRVHSRHETLADAIIAAPRSGQPKQTGTHEWAFIPEESAELVLISDHKMEP